MSSLKKLQDEKLDIREKEVVFANENAKVCEFKNASTGNGNQLYLKLKESIKKAKAIDIIVSYGFWS